MVGFETAHIPHRDFQRLVESGSRWQWRPTVDLVETLRERKDDIPLLVDCFVDRYAQRGCDINFGSAAMNYLLAYKWPGNVRELEHAVERSVLMAAGATVSTADLGLRRSADGATSLESMPLEDVEAFLIKKALVRYGNVTAAAESLGLSRSALYRRLERYGIEP